MSELTDLVARRMACPSWPDCADEDDEGQCLACTQAGKVIAALKRAQRLEKALIEIRDWGWYDKDPRQPGDTLAMEMASAALEGGSTGD